MRRLFSNMVHSRSKSVLTKWAVSYLLILLIPNLIFVYSYLVTVPTVKSEIRSANQMVLGNLQSNFDRLLSDAREAYAYTYGSKQFSLAKKQAEKNDQFSYESAQLVQNLNDYTSINNKKIGILVYFRDRDYIATESTANQSRYIYGAQTFSGITIPYSSWLGTLSKDYKNEFFLSSDLHIGATTPCFVYANTVQDISIFVTIPISFAEEYSNGLGDQTLMIHTEDGQYVTSFGQPIPIKDVDFSLPSGSAMKDGFGNSFISMYLASEQTHWVYSIVSPESSFFKVSKSLSYLLIGSFIASLILGTVLVWLLLQKNYKPLGSILSFIEHKDAPGDEFERIKNSYKRLASENQTMQSTLSRHAEQLRERYILSRLKGKKTYIDDMEFNSYFQLDIQKKSFLVVAFSIRPFLAMNSSAYQDELEYYNINMFAVDNAFCEMMDEYSFYRVEDGQLLLYVFSFNTDQQEQWKTSGYTKIAEICELFNDRLSVSLTAAISEATEHFSYISLLYSDVMDALEYKSIIGESGVICTTDLKETDLILDQNIHNTRELTEAVGNGNYPMAKKIITEVFEKNQANTALPFAVFRILTMNYLNAALSAFYESVLDVSQYNKQLVLKLEALTASSKPETLHQCFVEFLYFLCQVITHQNEAAENKLMDKIKNYIQEHYKDCNLNISMIADEFQRSPRYISHIFKIQTGSGLLDCINQIRITKAKEIMEQEGITMEELAKRVGYTNDRTFRRAFQRMEGTTPGKYLMAETE